MKAISKAIVKGRALIFLISLVLLVPSVIGFVSTRINYDVLAYLPGDIDTMKGQQILKEEFGTGAFSMVVVENMPMKETAKLKEKVEGVEHVKKVLWYDSFADLSIPAELLPDRLSKAFINDEATMMVVLFDTGTSEDETMDAIRQIRRITAGECFISGMSAIVTDTKDLSDQETPIYVLIAVVLSAIVLSLTMDSYMIPLFFLISIGMAILYNLGSNIFLGEISYITKALAAVLQLGVTMDYSIFLWHSYEEEKEKGDGDKEAAMAAAIQSTFSSVLGSSVTTVAGFIALCFMSFTLGLDLGIVMAKGVLIGVICCVTVLPSLILIFDKVIEKTRHKPLIPKLSISEFVAKHYRIIALVFALAWIPAVIGYQGTQVYYKLDASLPEELSSIQANKALGEHFSMNTMHLVLFDEGLSRKQKMEMADDIGKVDGVKAVLGIDSLLGASVPEEMIPKKLTDELRQGGRELLMITSEYEVASDAVNAQCDAIEEVVKRYDPNGLLIGEAPCTRDLIKITDQDFATVSAVSIGVIFVIILFVFGSVSLPFILVVTIEFAIFVNMGIPYYTGAVLPFVASIVIGTIQLGSTVDYAILMTNRYKAERMQGRDKKSAVITAHQASIQSIFVSAMSFFAATFGVGLYSRIDMISQLCSLMARGALISMTVVILVLPSMLIIFDRLILVTTKGMRTARAQKPKEHPIDQKLRIAH
ncbi:MAG: MMPL family transporter [Lachnospiraceae bacterium]|nr:MMPL family transporter [Lachnospiraceae bacterium]